MDLALANRSTPDVMGVPVPLLIVGGVITLAVAYTFLRFYFKDRRAREGVSFFKRRRVLRTGIAVDATILSSSPAEAKSDVEDMEFYSNVYEIPAPPGGEPIRTRGIELLSTDAPSGYASSALNLTRGEKVAVRYDPVDRTTVMVDGYQKLRALQKEAAERDAKVERVRQANAIALKEREARLLRGDPPD